MSIKTNQVLQEVARKRLTIGEDLRFTDEEVDALLGEVPNLSDLRIEMVRDAANNVRWVEAIDRRVSNAD